MSHAIPLKSAECNLEKLLKELSLGESITLTGPEGGPVALLISLKPEKMAKKTDADWDARMDDLAQRVSRSWSGEKSAVDILSEIRR